MTDLETNSFYNEEKDSFITAVKYDNGAVLHSNLEAQKQAPETGRYKGNFVHIGEIHVGDIIRLKTLGYDLLSSDPEEFKRALLYIQSNERHMLKMPGNPIAKKKTQWV